MDKIDNLKDETIRTLAQTLRSSGLAASDSEAIRMASNMAQTNTKVNNNFEERKEKNTMGLSFLHKEKNTNLPKQEIKEEEAYAEDEPQHTEDCSTCGCCETEEELTEKEESLNELFETETKDEFIKQDLLNEEQQEREQPQEKQKEQEQPEITQEVPIKDDRPKRDLSSYKEASVDLGDVFKFKG